MKKEKKSRKTAATALFWAVVAVVFLLKAAGGLRGLDLDGFLAVVTFVSVAVPVVIFVLVFGRTLSRKRQGSRAPRPDRRREDRPLPTAPQRTFSPVVYDANLREDSAARDRARRLEQLDGFYRNGIVEKEEYQKLRRHYENS